MDAEKVKNYWVVESDIEITAFNIESRYSDEDGSFKKKCTKEFAKGWLNKTEEIHKWLKSML